MKKVKKVDLGELKIKEIKKSYKFDGYVFITEAEGDLKSYKRRYYEAKGLGKLYCYFKGDIYTFRFKDFKNSLDTYDIVYEGRYVENNDSFLKKANGESEKVETETKVEDSDDSNGESEIKHEQYNKILTCVEQDIPVYLFGPAGSGKNHVLQQVADELDLNFYFTNSIQQEYKITGFIDAGGHYHDTEFRRAFENGGLFFLDELDASIPEVLVLLNAAIANRYFEFPDNKVIAHEDFRVVSAGNTVGDGASEEYVGRLQLDQATLDRFVMIEFGYSEKIELAIAKGNKELVDFIRNLRQQAEDKGVRATFSYRAIASVVKLEGKLELKDVMMMAVFKGMDRDTIATFDSDYSKYGTTLIEIKYNK